MRVLVTGSTGQVGHALLSSLRPIADVIIPPRAQFDLTQTEQLRASIHDIKPDLIINPAAYTAVDKAEDEPELAHQINAIAPGIIAEEAKKLGIPLIHYSTDYVFDGEKKNAGGTPIPYTETDTTHPLSVYGETKLQGEQAIRDSGCNHLILRTSWVYSDFGKNFLLTMLKLAKEREQLKVVNDQWGAPTSAIWIAQVTAQLIQQSRHADNPATWWNQNSGTLHLTPTNFTTWSEFASTIFAKATELGLLTKQQSSIIGIASKEYPSKAQRPKNSMLSTDKLQKKMGIKPTEWQVELQYCLQKIATKYCAFEN